MSYICGAYLLGMWAILSTGVFTRWVLGVPLLGHAMIMAGYMVHECAHGTIFLSVNPERQNEAHKWLGEVMLWICGAIYTPYHVIKKAHNRHHTFPYDVLDWDIHTLLENSTLRSVILAAERAYIPILEWIVSI